MQRSSTIFLQVVIVFIGIAALTFMFGEPHFEGRNANATLFEIYFKDPFLAYAYIASISFFVALYQAFKLLGRVRRNEVFSQDSARALRIIKYSSITLAVLIAAPVAYLLIVRPGDDIAGGVFIGTLITLASLVVAATATVFEGLLQSVVDMEPKNNLTL